MRIRIKDSSGENHWIDVEGEHPIDIALGIIRDAKDFVTFQVKDGDEILEVAVAKEHIVSVMTYPKNAEDNKRRKGRQLLF